MMLLQILSACGTTPDTLDLSSPGPEDEPVVVVDTEAPEEGPEPCALTDDGRLPAGEEGPYLARDLTVALSRARCEALWMAGAGARGSTLELELVDWQGAGPARLSFLDLLGQPLAVAEAAVAGDRLQVELPQTGEVLVRVEPADPDEEGAALSLRLGCVAGCELAWTRHPLVLMHGMGGTDSFVGLFNYFIGVKDDLEGLGYAVVTPAVDAFAPPETRAAMWAEHLDALLAEGRGRRFNLVGHSQGGLDARYLTTALGYHPHVASITTLATPHHGTSVADLLGGVLDASSLGRWVVDGVAALFTDLFGLGEADFTESILRLGPEEMATFNTLVPDMPGVRYFSWTGRTCAALDFTCQSETDGEIADLHFLATHLVISTFEGPNDGLVPVSSAEWGEVRGEMKADHLNQIGFFSATAPFDHLAFFRAEAAHLAEQGL